MRGTLAVGFGCADNLPAAQAVAAASNSMVRRPGFTCWSRLRRVGPQEMPLPRLGTACVGLGSLPLPGRALRESLTLNVRFGSKAVIGERQLPAKSGRSRLPHWVPACRLFDQ